MRPVVEILHWFPNDQVAGTLEFLKQPPASVISFANWQQAILG
ncbi:MAG: hypothetical protein WA639_09525 [Candidatus Acidiferrum sp.]